MTYAFLFLTYNNPIIDYKMMRTKISNSNIYIHPKYPENINNDYKKYIINNLIQQTKWCDISIVYSTINLLETAYINNQNEWFFLLSEDTYILYDFDKFKSIFESIHNNKSVFNFISKNEDYYKTSQWWVLNRIDVKIILDNYKKYIDRFIRKSSFGCADELFFLSVLKLINPKYEFTNNQIIYDKWIKNTVQRSPSYINHLLKHDKLHIENNNCLIIRKITKYFTPELYNQKDKLYIIYIGTETNQKNIILNDKFDYILIISIDIKLIDEQIIKKAIYIHNIIYKFYYETIFALSIEKFIKNWRIIVFTTEKFNMSNYNKIIKKKQRIKYNTSISNKKFYLIHDKNNELAYCLKNKLI